MSEPAAPPARPEWLPDARSGVRTAPCGRWFDAVLAIGRMQHRSGPVIEDQVQDAVTWLVPVGTADAWDLPGVQVLGHGHEIRVPPPGWRGAIQWLMEPPAVGDCLTRGRQLAGASCVVCGSPLGMDTVRIGTVRQALQGKDMAYPVRGCTGPCRPPQRAPHPQPLSHRQGK